jgi:DNA-binding SARP family transcriptional activator/outer membrane protein assembly factor BamB
VDPPISFVSASTSTVQTGQEALQKCCMGRKPLKSSGVKGFHMEFRVLGPVAVYRDGKRLPVGGTKQRAVLALLLLGRGEVVSRGELIDGVWGTSPPATVDRTLSAYVSRLRRLLQDGGAAPRLTREPHGYRLRVETGELDLDRFDALADEGVNALDAGDLPRARNLLTAALGLFAGTPLQDLLDVPAWRLESDKIAEKRIWALDQRVQTGLMTGTASEDIAELRSLVSKEPFREHTWALLMRAMYQSGQQGEALDAFDQARRILDEELGLEPGPELRGLQHQILTQDPALDSPVPHVRTPPELVTTWVSGRWRRWKAIATATSIVIVAVLGSVVLTATRSPAPDPGDHRRAALRPALVRPGTVIVDVRTGRRTGYIPKSQLNNAAYPVYAGGHFWVAEWAPSALVEIDPASGRAIRHIDPPANRATRHRESSTVTPFAVDGDSLWMSDGDDLVKMSTLLGREIGRIRLDDLGHGSGLGEGVAIGGGSVWVSRDVGGGQILRLDARTGVVEKAFNQLRPHVNLTYGGGTLWAADTHGLVAIDAATGSVRTVPHVHGNCPGGGGECIMAGDGVGWTSQATTGRIYKAAVDGRLAGVIQGVVGAGTMGHTAGRLWVGSYSDGTVSAYDPRSGNRLETYHFAHPVDSISAGGPYLLVSLSTGTPIGDVAAGLSSPSAVFLAHPGELGDGDEPALNVDVGAYQIEYATCANLLRYPDAPPPRGQRLAPEVAAAMPSLSNDHRTYRFTISSGFRFSPPSDQPVTAQTFKYSIERALSPRLAENPTGQRPPGPHIIGDIVGETAYRRGKRPSISGIHVHGNTLSITLVRPSVDFLARLTAPFFCPVPRGTPFIGGGPYIPNASGGGTVVSDGPYYVDNETNGAFVMLKQNPNYAGERPRHFKEIMIREDVAGLGAITLVINGTADGITYLPNPRLEPGGPVNHHFASTAPRRRPSYRTTRSSGHIIAQLVGPGIGCRIYSPHAYGLDLTAICPTQTH